MTIEQFIEKWTAEGEQTTVGDNLILNRGPANQDALAQMNDDMPPGTIHTPDYGFGDDVQRVWFNPNVPFVVAFSKLSHSIHIWRYPNRLTYVKQTKDVGGFFSKEAFSGYEDLAKYIDDPNTPDDVLDLPVRSVIKCLRQDVLEAVLGNILDTTIRELQVDVMIDRLGE